LNRAHRVALVCGATPLVVGIAIFVTWLVLRLDVLMLAGAYTLCGGMALFVVGGVALARYHWLGARTPSMSGRHLRRSTAACAGLLLLNFPIAGGIVAGALAIETSYTVIVHNASARPLEKVMVIGGGVNESLGSIPAGGTTRQWFWIQHDGQLEFRAACGTSTHSATIDGYVTNGMGGSATVTVNADETITVTDGNT